MEANMDEERWVEELPSKIIQISTHNAEGRWELFALCEDGSVWHHMGGREWVELHGAHSGKTEVA